MKIECAFNKGKYVEITAEHLEKIQQEKLNSLMVQVGMDEDE